ALKTDHNHTHYLTPQGWQPFKEIQEIIHVKEAKPIVLTVRETIWGPVLHNDGDKHFAFHWVLYHPESLNANLLRLEAAQNIDEALRLAPHLGMPQQNAVIVDRDGNIAWTIFGPVPDKMAADYRYPGDWSSGTVGWRGFLPYAEHPKVKNPPHGRLWSANGRTVSGDTFRKVGDGGFVLGARQRQIRDRLFAMTRPIRIKDLYALSLDDEARLLQRWAPRAESIAKSLPHQAANQIVSYLRHWDGRARADSVAYRLVRTFRDAVHAEIVGAINQACRQVAKECNYWRLGSRREIVVWELITQKPNSWLPRGVASWQALAQRAAEKAWAPVLASPEKLAQWTWGQRNQTRIEHPIMRHIPGLAHWYRMPHIGQSGDWFMPKVAQPAFGQSERLVVQPGNEAEGLFNMPVGQSAHPWSPYFGRMHGDWQQGKPQSFWPGKTKWALRLVPVN
ncbi:MAG: penicillin acylase family protein, partial [Gammaproteobacteria bacterium]